MNDTTPRKKPNLEPFVWYPKGIEDLPNIRTLNEIMSLANGIETVLEIIEADGLNNDDADAHSVLDVCQVWNLVRLAIVCARTISKECDEAFEWSKEHGVKNWVRVQHWPT